MRKNTFTLLLFIVVGLLAGSIAGQLLSGVKYLEFLTHSAAIEWHPQADLQVIKYDLHFWVKLNVISILGLIAAIWLYRKL